jgi:hypothetical protein
MLGINMARWFITGIAALFLSTGTARAVEIPKQYRGDWCQTKWQTIIYKRGLKDCSGAELEIRRTYWNTIETTCTLTGMPKRRPARSRAQAA